MVSGHLLQWKYFESMAHTFQSTERNISTGWNLKISVLFYQYGIITYSLCYDFFTIWALELRKQTFKTMTIHIFVKVVHLKFLQWLYKIWIRSIYPSINCINGLVHLFAFWLWNFFWDIFQKQRIWNYNGDLVVVSCNNWYFLQSQFFFWIQFIIQNLNFYENDIKNL